MTDQTPDLWKTVFMRTAGTCVPGMWVYPADEVSEALAAERERNQQEIAKIDTDFEAVLAAVDAERNDWRDELAQRDETIRQLQDAFARCQEVQQATAETWRIEHDHMAEQIRLLRGAMAADDERLRRAAEQAGILYVSCDTAEALAEQIARLSAQVAELEAERAAEREAELADPVAQRADRYAAEASDLTLRLIAAEAERDAAQQQIATLTQERDWLRDRAGVAEAERTLQVTTFEARCATLTAALERMNDGARHQRRRNERLRSKNARHHREKAAIRSALVASLPCVKAAAQASHMMDGFTIGGDGLPRSNRTETAEDRVLAQVCAALARNALSGVPTP